MADFYPIIKILDDAPELPEQQGTKTKYWFHKNEKRFLFKIGRTNTGENWAEKVACELCSLLGLPHAHYELAVWKEEKGVLTESFVPKHGRLIMGNELLAEVHSTYPDQQRYKAQDHTLGRIYSLLSSEEILLPLNWQSPSENIENAVDVFIGYLLLDVWIANQDRHHENWGIIHDNGIYLAPTYDHAASMGQNERDGKREELLTTKDQGRSISRYVLKARSAIYLSKSEKKPLLTIDVFQEFAKKRPKSANLWLQRLNDISLDQCQNIFNRVPSTEISEITIKFAMKLLELNKERLLRG
ncbi:MAG: HipA domain-containing protein [Nitrosomonas sp.]|nr:HipA domain-containing protein [Nitrosomonas sp.]